MKTLKRNPTLAFLGIMALAACEDGTPTAPIVDELFTRDGMIELDVLASAANVAVALALADASNNVASSRGDVRAQDGRELHDRARLRFAEAQDDLARGNRRGGARQGPGRPAARRARDRGHGRRSCRRRYGREPGGHRFHDRRGRRLLRRSDGRGERVQPTGGLRSSRARAR